MISQHQLFGTIVKISFYRVPKACFPSCIVGDFSWYYLYIYIYIYKTEDFEAPTIFHVSTVLKNKK